MRRLMEAIAREPIDPEVLKIYRGDVPRLYGPPTREEMVEIEAAEAYNRLVVAEMRERLLDAMPGIEDDE